MGEYITMILIPTSICPYCKKEFVPAPMHGLTDGDKRYCKPTCFLRRHDSKKRKDGKWASIKKPVLLYNKEGELIKEYPSIKEATEALGLGRKTINGLLKEKRPMRNGEYFKYKENNNAR